MEAVPDGTYLPSLSVRVFDHIIGKSYPSPEKVGYNFIGWKVEGVKKVEGVQNADSMGILLTIVGLRSFQPCDQVRDRSSIHSNVHITLEGNRVNPTAIRNLMAHPMWIRS